VLILEPQEWSSYKKKARHTPEHKANYRAAKLRPEQFHSLLMDDLGFTDFEVLKAGAPKKAKKAKKEKKKEKEKESTEMQEASETTPAVAKGGPETEQAKEEKEEEKEEEKMVVEGAENEKKEEKEKDKEEGKAKETAGKPSGFDRGVFLYRK
jgi:hypothetical protein